MKTRRAREDDVELMVAVDHVADEQPEERRAFIRRSARDGAAYIAVLDGAAAGNAVLALLEQHDRSEAARACVEAEEREIALYERNKAHVSYGFYVARKVSRLQQRPLEPPAFDALTLSTRTPRPLARSPPARAAVHEALRPAAWEKRRFIRTS